MGLPLVHITAVPQVSTMVGVNRVLRGSSINNPLGDKKLKEENERELKHKYDRRALEILTMDDIDRNKVFNLEETEQ